MNDSIYTPLYYSKFCNDSYNEICSYKYTGPYSSCISNVNHIDSAYLLNEEYRKY